MEVSSIKSNISNNSKKINNSPFYIENKWKNKRRIPNISTREGAIREIKRCQDDPVYFIFTYCWIQEPIRGKIKLDEYPYLIDLIQDLINYRFNIVNKSRQLGITTIMACFIAWLILFHNDKQVLVIANKGETAKNLIKKIKFIVKTVPKWLLPKMIEDNVHSVGFTNGSFVKSVATTEDAARSEALSYLVIDEAAHIKNVDPEEVWISAQPTLITGGGACILSTPNGQGNWFHRTYIGAENNENIFHSAFLPWYVHPLRDQRWRDEQDRLGSKKAKQECDADFLTSGDTVINGEILTKHYQQLLVRDPIERLGLRKDIHIYKKSKPGCRYIISADSARGDAGSRSAFTVINRDEMSVDADFFGMIHPTEFGHLLIEMGYLYNDALLVPENNYLGVMVLQPIVDSYYPNLYYTMKGSDKIVDTNTIQNGVLYDDQKIAGFSTHGANRTLMIERMVELVEGRLIEIYSKRIIDQMLTFKFIGNKAKAESGYNDDLILSLSIGCWLLDIASRVDSIKSAYTRHLLDGTSADIQTYNSYDDFSIDGSAKKKAYNYWNMEIQHGNQKEVINLYDMLIKK